MPLEVHPATAADMEDLARIQTSAFKTSPMVDFLFPNPLTEDGLKGIAEKHVKSLDEPDVTYLKVIDTDLDGKMIAAAKWRINEKERDREEWEKMLPKPGKEDEGIQARLDFYAYLSRVRTTYMGGKPYACMFVLVTGCDNILARRLMEEQFCICSSRTLRTIAAVLGNC